MSNLHNHKGNFPHGQRSRIWEAVILLAVILTGCQQKIAYYQYRSIPETGWQRNDTLSFAVETADSARMYRMDLEVRNRNDYPYRNLAVGIAVTTPDSLSLPTDTLQLLLADEAGHWIGRGQSNLYQYTAAAGGIHVHCPGTYRIRVFSLLPDSILPGLNDIGIRLER